MIHQVEQVAAPQPPDPLRVGFSQIISTLNPESKRGCLQAVGVLRRSIKKLLHIGMMNQTFRAFAAFAVTCGVHAEPEVRKEDRGRDFFKIPGMYACSMDMKATMFIDPLLTPEMREHINKSRWTKGQHKLPDGLSGYSFDLNGDGVREHFVHTGEYGAGGDPNMLVLQIAGDRVEIIAAIQGSFGLIEGEGDWADIVEFNFSGPAYRAKTGLRFDGGSYKRTWRIEQPDADSKPIKIEQGVAPQSATRSESKLEGGDKPHPESEARSR